MCNGVSLPLKIAPLFFAKPPLKSGNCPSPLFRQSLYILFFCDPLPLPQNWIFQGTPKILRFSSLTLSHLLKFLNLNFHYLYMIRYKTFLFIIFFVLIFQIWFYFLCRNCNPPWKKSPFSFSATPPPKIEILSSKFGSRLNPLSRKRGFTLCNLWSLWGMDSDTVSFTATQLSVPFSLLGIHSIKSWIDIARHGVNKAPRTP